MAQLRVWDWYGDGSVLVVDIGLACCSLEFEAAAIGRPRDDLTLDRLPPESRVIVVISGTVTDRLTPTVVRIVEQVRAARPSAAVVAFGACASAGGPYWDSYCVTKGIDQLVQVDAYVPGCPPPAEALNAVVDELSGRVHV